MKSSASTTSTPVYQLKDLVPEKLAISPYKFFDSKIENSQNYHQNLGRPNVKDGERDNFEIAFPKHVMASPLNCTTKPNGVRTHHMFIDVYGNYHIAYNKVNTEIDTMLSGLMPNTTSEQLKDLLVVELVKRGHPKKEIEERYEEVVQLIETPFNEEYFRYIAISFLIHAELEKDTEGTEIAESMARLKETYAALFDANLTMKKKIYAGITLNIKQHLNASCLEHIDDVLRWQNHQTVKGLIDFSKSPQIHVKMMEGVPKADAKPPGPSAFCLDPMTGQMFYTSIVDYVANPNSTKPINSAQQLENLVYRKGDSKNGKANFRLMLRDLKTVVSFFWGEKSKRCEIQFKATYFKTMTKTEIASGSRTITDEERQRDIEEAREAAERFGLSYEPQQQQQQPDEQPAQQKRNFASTQTTNYDDADMDALRDLEQDEYYQSTTKKSRFI